MEKTFRSTFAPFMFSCTRMNDGEIEPLGFCWLALIPVTSLVAAMTFDQQTGKPQNYYIPGLSN
jgi:hypothetical protein